jgi:hypothetical protein
LISPVGWFLVSELAHRLVASKATAKKYFISPLR